VKRLLIVLGLGFVGIGCGPLDTWEEAERACGKGNIAYVDDHDGQFGCKGTQDDD
jgi:hypothetical protein